MIKVSVLIPYHNDSRYLGIVLKRLREYHNDDVEFIVVDDGSAKPPDLDKDPRVRLITNSHNRGVGYSFDRAAEAARGDILVLTASDVMVKNGHWVNYVTQYAEAYPKSILCSTCVGLNDENLDVDDLNNVRRYGADLVFKLSKDNLPLNSTLRQKPAYFDIIESKWRNTKPTDINPIPNLHGAFYIVSKEWYFRLGGFDTKRDVRFRGHMIWGALEPYLSIKNYLYGGNTLILPEFETGHVFGREIHRLGRLDLKWWNKLFMLYTMFPEKETKELINYIERNYAENGISLKHFNEARHYIKVNMSSVTAIRERNQSFMTRTVEDYLREFNYTI